MPGLAIILGQRKHGMKKPYEEEDDDMEEETSGGAMQTAAKALLDAIKADDAEAVAEALSSAIACSDMED